MPVELILRAENKADTIKTQQSYLEQQVRFTKKNFRINYTIYFILILIFLASTKYCWCYLPSN